MPSTRLSPAARRRLGVICFVIAILGLVGLAPSDAAASPAPSPAPTEQQPAAQPAKPQARVFGADAGMVFNTIKGDKTADFEMVIGKLKEALQKSDKPERKQQAASWKVYKSDLPVTGGNVLYIFIVDPPVKGADYTVSTILAEGFPTEVQELFKVFSAAYVSLQYLNLQITSDLGK